MTAAVYRTAIKETHSIYNLCHTKTLMRRGLLCIMTSSDTVSCNTQVMLDQQKPVLNAADRFGSSVISGFRREVPENCASLGYYAASGDSLLPTFRDNFSVPSSRGKQ